ncbi:MAG: DUF4332 domain-containing protein [Hyphomicrobium sp.]
MSTCRCCGQEIASTVNVASGVNTIVQVDEALLALCNAAYEDARARGGGQVEIAHLVWVMTQARAWHESLEALGCSIWSLREVLETELANTGGAAGGSPRTSDQLKLLLGRAAAYAARSKRSYAGAQDVIAVMMQDGDDLASRTFLHRARLLSPQNVYPHSDNDSTSVQTASHDAVGYAPAFTVADLARSVQEAWPGRTFEFAEAQSVSRGTLDTSARLQSGDTLAAPAFTGHDFTGNALNGSEYGANSKYTPDSSGRLAGDRTGHAGTRQPGEWTREGEPPAIESYSRTKTRSDGSERDRTQRDLAERNLPERERALREWMAREDADRAARERSERERAARDAEAMRTLTLRIEKQDRLLEQLVASFGAFTRTSEERARAQEREAASARSRETNSSSDDTESARQRRLSRAHSRWRRRRSWRSLRSWRKRNRDGSSPWPRRWKAGERERGLERDFERNREPRMAHDAVSGTGTGQERVSALHQPRVHTATVYPYANREPLRAFQASANADQEVDAEPDQKAEEADTDDRPVAEREKRFYLALDDEIEKAPSIGPRTAAYLSRAGIYKVRDLFSCNPEQAAAKIGVRYITAQRLALWQAQSRLVCTVPWLRGTHAQLLAGAGFDTLEKIEGADKSAVCAAILQFAQTRDGQSVLRSGNPPDIERVGRWVEAASLAEPERAAA